MTNFVIICSISSCGRISPDFCALYSFWSYFRGDKLSERQKKWDIVQRSKNEAKVQRASVYRRNKYFAISKS